MSRYEIWISFVTIVAREIRRFLRIWPQTIIPPIITIVLYFLIFGNLIGGRIGHMSGLPYIQFVAPGLIMMSVITNSYSNVVSSFFGSKFQRNIMCSNKSSPNAQSHTKTTISIRISTKSAQCSNATKP